MMVYSSSKEGEKLSASWRFEIEPTRFTVGKNEGCKIMQRVVDESKVFGWSNWQGRVAIYREWEDGCWQACRFGGRTRSLILNILGLRCLAHRISSRDGKQDSKISGWASQVGNVNLGAIRARLCVSSAIVHTALCAVLFVTCIKFVFAVPRIVTQVEARPLKFYLLLSSELGVILCSVLVLLNSLRSTPSQPSNFLLPFFSKGCGWGARGLKVIY